MKKWWRTEALREAQPSVLSRANGSRGAGVFVAPPHSPDNKICSNASGGGDSSAAADSGDLFGGMEVVRTRHRRSAASTAGSHTPRGDSSASVQMKDCVQPLTPAAEPSPFFMRFEMSPGAVQDEEEAPQVTQMRQRLERYFELYNPSKLSQVEDTIKAFMGREEELFVQLVSNYGPEPNELKASALPRGDKLPPPGAASETESAFDFIASGAKKHRCDNREGVAANTPLAAVVSSCMRRDAADLNPRQTPVEAAHTLLDDGDGTKPAFDFLAPREAGEPSGFDVVPLPAVAGAKLAPDSAAEETDGAAVRNAEGMHTEAKTESDAAPHVCRSALESDEDSNDKEEDTTVEENVKASCSRGHKCSGSSSSSRDKITGSDAKSGTEAIWDIQRREVQDSQGDVLLARANLSLVLDEIRASIERRRECMTAVSKLEKRVEQCAAEEAFEEAALLSAELEQLGAQLAELDGAPVRLLASLCARRDAAVEVVRSLARLLRRHRQELIDSKDGADRRVRKFIQEVTRSLETRREEVGAAIEQAKRLEESARREQTGLRERRAALREKMLRQSEELRTLQGRVSQEKMEVDAEIAALEAKLATLRRTSAEKAAELQEVTSTLLRVEAEQESMERDIDNFLNEEEDRVRVAAANLEQLQQESDVLRAEAEAFDAKRDSLLSELQDCVTRIDVYEQRQTLLERETLSDLQKYTNAVVELLRMRNAGRGVLFTAPSLTSCGAAAAGNTHEAAEAEEEEEETPLSHVNRLRRQLSTLNAEDETSEALVASLGVQLAETRNNIPLLEAAKKAAAAALRFKEAQLKADEIRRQTASMAGLTAAIDAAQERIRANALERSSLQQQLTQERAKAAARARGFLARYRDALEAAAMVTSATATPNLLQLAAEDAGHDELAEAMQRLMTTLQQECSEAALPDRAEEGNDGVIGSPEAVPKETTASMMNEKLGEQGA
ncbi:uncharacterized protein Tco025E_06457 [Trypanosoma conorhini]|uniref:Uncharacterized protein n=1 Tax=Trypanosoma conorhini TaxID=83891 RepID=A0A3R7MBJ2_9TRYP|nr:uncharacterized protein Tco025E_06457 [Trypanosoma conorhini]RNF12403.1 hypothetical protein Tco025E_06457 [Trypanosoma conorhini]